MAITFFFFLVWKKGREFGLNFFSVSVLGGLTQNATEFYCWKEGPLDRQEEGGRGRNRGEWGERGRERLTFRNMDGPWWQKHLLDLPSPWWTVGTELSQGHKLTCPQCTAPG